MRVERLRADDQIDVKFTHFPLHPDTPVEGLTLEQLFAGRNIDIPAAKARMVRLMADEGLDYGDRTMTYNSRLAQELAKWHREQVVANADVQKARRRVYTMEPEWRFSMPTGLTFDVAKSRLIVTDTQRGRVQIYNKLHDYMEPQFNL